MNGAGLPQKRPRLSSQGGRIRSQQAVIIDISSDSDSPQPQSKRQKSTPPVRNDAISSALLQRHAKSANSGTFASEQSKSVTPGPSQPDRRDASSATTKSPTLKPSPFKNLPNWSVQAAQKRAAQTSPNIFPIKETSSPASEPKSQRSIPQIGQSKSSEIRTRSDLRPNSRLSVHTTMDRDKVSAASGQKLPDTKQKSPKYKSAAFQAAHKDETAQQLPSDTDREINEGEDGDGGVSMDHHGVSAAEPRKMPHPKYYDSELEARIARQSLNDSDDHDDDDEDEDSDILERFRQPVLSQAAGKDKQRHPPSALQSNVNLTVAIRPSPSPAKSQKFSVEVPLSQTEEQSATSLQAERDALFKELVKSADVAKERLPEVEKHFGQTGFSRAFDADDTERMIRAGPVYKRPRIDGFKWFVETDLDALWNEVRRERGWGPEPPVETSDRPVMDVDAVLKDIFDRHFADHPDPPMSFRNDIDDRRIYGKFQFMPEHVIREGVKLAPASTNRGCGCAGQCIPAECACLLKYVPVNPSDDSNKQTKLETVRTYYQEPRDPSLTVLRPDYIENELTASKHHYEITECNEICGCGPDCWNRVVGRGRTLRLEIYMTERCGFGVRYPHGDILKGQFLDVYLGELITKSELLRRESAKHPDEPSYVYALDWFAAKNCYYVDGELFSSPMRFVNHSCDPNARSFVVQTHQGDKHVYHLAFFAIRDIPAGEQITIDYCPQEADSQLQANVNSNEISVEADSHLQANVITNGVSMSGSGRSSQQPEDSKAGIKNKLPIKKSKEDDDEKCRSRCYCGAANCRLWMWRDAERRRKKRGGRFN